MVSIEEVKAELHEKGVDLSDKECEILLEYLSQIVEIAIKAHNERELNQNDNNP